MRIAAVLFAALVPLCAQEIKLPSLDNLATKAKESVDVTLDGSMLRLAAKFLGDGDSDEARAKKAISELQSVMVRSFEFEKDNEYDPSDVNALRSQLQSPTWSHIVNTRSKTSGENVDVYFKMNGKSQLAGVFIISAQPRELTIVNITGVLDPDHLADLGGQFHIPSIDLAFVRKGDRNPK